MVNRRHAGGRREVQRKNQRPDDTGGGGEPDVWIKEGNRRWKWWGQ